MGVVKLMVWFLVLGAVTAAIIGWWLHHAVPKQVPHIPDKWWGPGVQTEDDPTINDFTIHVSDEVLDDLKNRLTMTRFSEPLEDSAFTYGFNAHTLRDVVTYWLDEYDWRQTEEELNTFTHFQTEIDGLLLHFLRASPDNVPDDVKVIPILLVHGWPGSFIEFIRVVPELTQPKTGEKFVFDVIVPSIPGYGYSEPPYKQGFTPISAAKTFDKLMQRLGFKNYYVHGGDMGLVIGTAMGVLFPERVTGIHLAGGLVDLPVTQVKHLVGSFFPSLIYPSNYVNDFYPIWNFIKFVLNEFGYCMIHATKPDTVGAGLQDSPAGLAAWILEKFSTWTYRHNREAPDGGLTAKFTLDQLLDNVMIYWVTGTITTSQRLYKEFFSDPTAQMIGWSVQVDVPTGIAMFPDEFVRFPKSFLAARYRNIVRFTEPPQGGHFAAYEEPQLVAEELWNFVSTVEKTRS